MTQLLGVEPSTAHRHGQVRVVLAACGLPVAPPLRTAAGRTLLEYDGGLFGVAPWLDGEPLPAGGWDTVRARRVGELLAALHTTLAEAFPEAAVPVAPEVPEGAAAKAAIDRYADAATGGARLTDEARGLLHARHGRLEDEAHLRPADGLVFTAAGYTRGPLRTHQLCFAAGGAIVAVHGWHDIAPRAHAEDLVRTAASLFGGIVDAGATASPDPGLVAALVAGYHSAAALDPAELLAAARLDWWRRLCDFSALERCATTGEAADLRRWVTESRLLLAWSDRRDELEAALLHG